MDSWGMTPIKCVTHRVHNEEDAISEWLAYHHGIIGVPRFYLYSDQTTDSARAAVTPYIKRGVVTWIDWDETSAQPIWEHLATRRI